MNHVDGNALAGALTLAFGTDMTAAIGECAHCGHRHPFAEAHVYLRCPGMVLRCPACSGLEIVMIESEGRLHLSVGGVASISLRKAKRTSASA
jgi:hypothetical protein